MTTPARKAAQRKKLEELVTVTAELARLDAKRDTVAARRDALIVAARREDPELSQRDVGAIANVSHAWVRKLEVRAG